MKLIQQYLAQRPLHVRDELWIILMSQLSSFCSFLTSSPFYSGIVNFFMLTPTILFQGDSLLPYISFVLYGLQNCHLALWTFNQGGINGWILLLLCLEEIWYDLEKSHDILRTENSERIHISVWHNHLGIRASRHTGAGILTDRRFYSQWTLLSILRLMFCNIWTLGSCRSLASGCISH